MIASEIIYNPSLDIDAIRNALVRYFSQGVIDDCDLNSRIGRLSRLFAIYASTCPVPFWAKGLKSSGELCCQTEKFLPYSELNKSLLRLIRLAIKVPYVTPPLISRVDNWIDLLSRLQDEHASANPGELIKRLAGDENLRIRFLFSVYLPDQYGGNFNRYPQQNSFLRQWLKEYVPISDRPLSCLDAACGSGEGSYELAFMIREHGFSELDFRVTGITVCPIEVFSAAFAYFPHAIEREIKFRRYLEHSGVQNVSQSIRFAVANLLSCNLTDSYDIITCNGMLGGPLLNSARDVANIVARFADSLNHGGVLLSADRFHAGWKKLLSDEDMKSIFTVCGLKLKGIGEGVAGIKP